MKRIFSTLTFSVFSMITTVIAMPPPVYYSGYYREQSISEKLYSYGLGFSLSIIIFSQIIFVVYLLRKLYQMYVSKVLQESGSKKILITLFAAVYCFAFFIFVLAQAYSIYISYAYPMPV